jgi:alpha,alpha-trehalase
VTADSLTTARRDEWILAYDGYVPEEETLREALCTLGNGRFATRGAAPEMPMVIDTHYPGTYLAGLFNRLREEQAGREIVNESMVNLPNWLPVTFKVDDGPWFSIDEVEIEEFRQTLEIDRGMLVRQVRFTDAEGRETSLTQRRLVSMARSAIAALETSIRAENWSGSLALRSSIDGGVENRNVDRYRDLRGDHLDVVDKSRAPGRLSMRVRTNQSRIEVVTATRHRVWLDDALLDAEFEAFEDDVIVGETLCLEVEEGSTLRLEKIMALFSSRDPAISEPSVACEQTLAHAPDFAALESEHILAWAGLWERFGIEMEADERVRQVTNLHIFHLLQVASPHVSEVDAGVPARGLHGEAYRGHIFWDELFVFPVLHTRGPEIAKSLLRYRYRRLPAARRLAEEAGYRGAMYPWQSGSDGSEETQEVHLNPKSGRWNPDLSHRQRHVNIAIAFNIIQYFRFTNDLGFLAAFGAEMLVEIARFWASIARYNHITDRFDIVGVMGPDEFHDRDPNWDGDGLRNNAYTNVMVAWLLDCVLRVLDALPGRQRGHLLACLDVDERELERWREMSRKLSVPMHHEVISQFEGYENLEEFDWVGYHERYGNVERLDRILEAEDDSVANYKASKQADVLMLFYLLSYEELVEVFNRLGIAFDGDLLTRTIDYYMERTSHGSTLSRLVHSWVLARNDRKASMVLFREALESDVSDIQGGTTPEGIHLGAMAGTVDLVGRGYSGMAAGADGVLRFTPSTPPEIRRIDFSVQFHGRWLDVALTGDDMRITSEITSRSPITIECRGERVTLASGETAQFRRVESFGQ